MNKENTMPEQQQEKELVILPDGKIGLRPKEDKPAKTADNGS